MLTNNIMSFNCKVCKYESNDKSNYARHLKSNKHKKNKAADALIYPDNPPRVHDAGYIEIDYDQNDIEPDKKEYICDGCGTKFAFSSGYYRHKKSRCFKEKSFNNDVKVLQKKVEILEEALKDQKIKFLEKQLTDKDKQLKELTSYIKSTKPTNTTNNYNISVKNYIQQNYSDAPHLIKLKDYELLEYDEEKKDDEINFGEVLALKYNQHKLQNYLGDFVVSQYKKEDPAQQSLWNSDVSRLTYIVKELLANKESYWSHDFKGLKTKSYIIEPLLDYIREYCQKYIDDHEINEKNRHEIKNCREVTETINALGNIMIDVKKGVLAEDIVKYIAPYFQINNKQEDFSFVDIDSNSESDV